MQTPQHISVVINRMYDRWVSKKEAAKIVGVSQKTIYNHRFVFGARLNGKKYEYHLKTLMDKAFDVEFLRQLKNEKLVEKYAS